MSRKVRLRILLPIAQTVSAATFGSVGLWQRYQILNQRLWGDKTLWESTAAYHVWPPPFRFAVVTNIPAFLAGALAEWPIGRVWPHHPEHVGYLPGLACVALLWYWVGLVFDAQSQASKPRTAVAVLVSFTALSVVGVFTPGYIGYVYYGVLLWVTFTVVLVRLRKRTGNQRGPASA